MRMTARSRVSKVPEVVDPIRACRSPLTTIAEEDPSTPKRLWTAANAICDALLARA
jgi:hypothetical protein